MYYLSIFLLKLFKIYVISKEKKGNFMQVYNINDILYKATEALYNKDIEVLEKLIYISNNLYQDIIAKDAQINLLETMIHILTEK